MTILSIAAMLWLDFSPAGDIKPDDVLPSAGYCNPAVSRCL